MDFTMKILIVMMLVLNMEMRTTFNCEENDYNIPCSLTLSQKDCQSLVWLPFNYSISLDETARAARDFGGIYHHKPAAIVCPASVDDIVRAVRTAAMSDHLTVAARGNGHSINGQAQSLNGIVIDMMSACMKGIHVSHGMGDDEETQAYVDVYAGELWVDVLKETLREGLTPRSWTDYLFLSVGGTLSNGGVSGQAFRFGPQIRNVLQLEVVTGNGEVITCSPGKHEELFYGVLGGLGQFGIITKARIVLERAPHMARWVRLFYSDFEQFSRDQEFLISIPKDQAFDYLEGLVVANSKDPINGWPSLALSSDASFDPSLIPPNSGPVLYCLEVALYYSNTTDVSALDKKIERMLVPLRFMRGLNYSIDVSYFDFLNRVYREEILARATGMWDAPHPWLNLFVPKSQIARFDNMIFKGILKNGVGGPMLLYPLNRNKWDCRMSTAVPDEEIFYLVGLLRFLPPNPGGPNSTERMLAQNEEILGLCETAGIEMKQYLPHYKTNGEWKRHFGWKWDQFVERKRMFDPRAILAPGQNIFSRSSVHID